MIKIKYLTLSFLQSELKTHGEDHQKVANYWNNLGLAWYAKGEYDKAIEFYEKALNSDLKTLGKDHQNVVNYWNNLGLAWYSRGEYDKPKDYFEKALRNDKHFEYIYLTRKFKESINIELED